MQHHVCEDAKVGVDQEDVLILEISGSLVFNVASFSGSVGPANPSNYWKHVWLCFSAGLAILL